MTIVNPTAAGAPSWLSRPELAHASGLREDLVARFVPATTTPTGRSASCAPEDSVAPMAILNFPILVAPRTGHWTLEESATMSRSRMRRTGHLQ